MAEPNFYNWIDFALHQEHLVAVKGTVCDRPLILSQFLNWSDRLELLVYFANQDYDHWQQVCEQIVPSGAISVQLTQSEIPQTNLLNLVRNKHPGIFIFEGLLSTLNGESLKQSITNLHFEQQRFYERQHIVLLDDEIELPLALHPILPVLEYPFPTKREIQQQIMRLCETQEVEATLEEQRQIVQACVGLPQGEIQLVMHRVLGQSRSAIEIAQRVLDYKQKKLRGRGINLLPKPDVESAVGLEGLDDTLDKIRLLLQPEAEQRNLRPPKAVLLWGIPGSGKSLAAKLAAQKIGATLVAADWNSLIGANVRESMANLNELIHHVSQIGTTILFFDEFEKAFSGWRSDAEGGVLGKLAGRLLSWMQDHTEPVVMFATINHLEMLPTEMVRRFDYIHFFGMPHAGALYQVFMVHLSKYFRYEFSEMEWRILLREYRGCTPDEVGKAVQRVAHEYFMEEMAQPEFQAGFPLVTLEALLDERQRFTPAIAQKTTSDQVVGILNKAKYAKSASGEDTSIFATTPQHLLGIDENAGKKEAAPEVRSLIHYPKFEDI
jgi:ATP-dependent 26S proteasome regulatory subunit